MDDPATPAALFVPAERMDPSLHYCFVQDDKIGRSLDLAKARRGDSFLLSRGRTAPDEILRFGSE